MSGVQLAMLAIVVTGVATGLARRLGVPAQSAVFAAGLAAGLWPGMPRIELDPTVVLDLVLTALTYATAASTSIHLLRHNLRAGVVLGLAFAAVAVVTCAMVTRAVLGPEFAWTAALLVGIVAAAGDDALRDAGREAPPRALTDVLKTQGLVAVVVIVSTFLALRETVERGTGVGALLLARVGFDLVLGVPFGAAVGWLLVQLRKRLAEPRTELAVSMATPFVVALAASSVGASSVPALLAAGFVVAGAHVDAQSGRPLGSAQARVAANGFWQALAGLLGGALFFVAGLVLPTALDSVDDARRTVVALAAGIALVLMPALVFACTWLATWLPELASLYRHATRRSRWCDAAVVAWASLRSPLALVVAFAVPEHAGGRPDTERDLLLAFAGALVAVSLAVQATTWRLVLTRLAGRSGSSEEELRDARRVLQDVEAGNAQRLEVLRLRRTNRIGDEDVNQLLLEIDERADLRERSR